MRNGADSKAETIRLFAQHVSSGKAAFFDAAGIDFALGERAGPYLWDLAGEKRLIDCHCNGGVFNLGHRNPEIVQTLVESLDTLDIGNHHLISGQRAALAQRLSELAPGDLTYTVFGVGGGEAIDLAIKVARGATRRDKVISAKGGYHGHTGLALAAGDVQYRAPFGPAAPGFLQIAFDDIDVLAQNIDDETAAVLFETVPATFGVTVPDPAFFPKVREICDRHGPRRSGIHGDPTYEPHGNETGLLFAYRDHKDDPGSYGTRGWRGKGRACQFDAARSTDTQF